MFYAESLSLVHRAHKPADKAARMHTNHKYHPWHPVMLYHVVSGIFFRSAVGVSGWAAHGGGLTSMLATTWTGFTSPHLAGAHGKSSHVAKGTYKLQTVYKPIYASKSNRLLINRGLSHPQGMARFFGKPLGRHRFHTQFSQKAQISCDKGESSISRAPRLNLMHSADERQWLHNIAHHAVYPFAPPGL